MIWECVELLDEAGSAELVSDEAIIKPFQSGQGHDAKKTDIIRTEEVGKQATSQLKARMATMPSIANDDLPWLK